VSGLPGDDRAEMRERAMGSRIAASIAGQAGYVFGELHDYRPEDDFVLGELEATGVDISDPKLVLSWFEVSRTTADFERVSALLGL
jgi:hypothetical protein